MGGDELAFWSAWQDEYDLPDGYFVAGQVCDAVARFFAGADLGAEAFVPYYRRPKRPQTPHEARAIVRAHLDAARRRNRV